MKKLFIAIVAVAAVVGGIFTCMSMTHVGQGEVGIVWTAKSGVQ